MNKLSTQLAVVGTATAMVLVFVGAPMVVRAAPATNVFCGQTLMQDTKLDGDLTCPGLVPFAALIIGADKVTLDLGGFTIAGTGADFGVFIEDEREEATVKNGTIQGFGVGVWAQGHHKLELSKLIFKNTEFFGTAITNGQDIVVRNSTFLSPPASSCSGNTAIQFRNVANVTVNNVDVHGGFGAVDISCILCDGTEAPTNGKITNSTFAETHIGVGIFNTSDLTISNNHFSNIVPTAACGFGFAIISVPFGAPRTGIKIKDNFIHDNLTGIDLSDLVAAVEIKGNQIRDNSVFGIGLFANSGTPSTGNLIKDNITSGNGVDLIHDISSSPNAWKNNSCETKDGADIPDC